MLENKLTIDDDRYRTFFVIDLSRRPRLSIGRAQDCHVRITDISVSRHHAGIHLINKEVWIEDKSSKFGTLIRL